VWQTGLRLVCWDDRRDDWVTPLRGLPVVKVVDADQRPLTNSVLEAHRLNSPYIANSAWFETLKREIGFDEKAPRPIEMQGKVYPTLLKYDPNSLIHGIFLEKIAGVIRTAPRPIRLHRGERGNARFERRRKERSGRRNR
jgi:CRISPR-associated protein Csb1